MEIKFKDALDLKSTNLKIDSNRYKKILDEIIVEIKDNKENIQKANDIDKKFYKTNIEIDKLINVVEKLKQKKLPNNANSKNILISYYGDPYITLELCIESIRTNNKFILLIEDYMLGINKLIINIVETILKDYRIENKVFLFNLLNKKEIEDNKKLIQKIICIGNKNTFEKYKKLKIDNLIYYPFNNIDVYCDTDELEELQKMIYEYGISNNIDVEIYDEFENINSAIEFINKEGSGFATVLLTKSKENELIFKNKINSKYIFINENPFGKYEFNIDEIII
jgi:hypothetical protein